MNYEYIDFLTKVKATAEHLKHSDSEMKKIIELLQRVQNKGNGRIFLCGNGGSASTASHMACDLFKMCGITAISLTENCALTSAIINDNGWENLFVYQLQNYDIDSEDILIAFSVHGGAGKDKAGKWSENIIQAIQFVNNCNGTTIGFAGFDGGAFTKFCDYYIVVPEESTPIVESFHVLLHHFIASYLQKEQRK